jgi:GDP-mannose transporter
MNKLTTIILNTFIWDQHAVPEGIFCLFVCIGGGMIYKQAPMRKGNNVPTVKADDEEFKANIGADVPSVPTGQGDEEKQN